MGFNVLLIVLLLNAVLSNALWWHGHPAWHWHNRPANPTPISTYPEFRPTFCPATNDAKYGGICKITCMRQYLTPISRTLTINHTTPVSTGVLTTATVHALTRKGPHWGDAAGEHIPSTSFLALANINSGPAFESASSADAASSAAASKAAGRTKNKTGRRKKKDWKPECHSFESCYDHCRNMAKGEKKVKTLCYSLLGVFVGLALGGMAIKSLLKRRRRNKQKALKEDRKAEKAAARPPAAPAAPSDNLAPVPEEQHGISGDGSLDGAARRATVATGSETISEDGIVKRV